ncbi:hypothetical protein HDU76_002837 [Blyttiomyces sp. JEL0837]|nr:hypothetical protein HDU76_002837 [Blyttiomyces sp. JEL0837]
MQIINIIAAVISSAAFVQGFHSGPKGVRLVHRPDDHADSALDRAAALSKRATAKLTYYGGPIIANVQVNPIVHGNAAYQSDLVGFYQNAVNSTYWDMRNLSIRTTKTLGRGTYGSAYVQPSPTSTTTSDDVNFIQPYLKNLVKTGVITPTANTYVSYIGTQFTLCLAITQGGYQSCSYFCAYHGTIDISSLNVGTKYLYFGVMPDQGGACAGGCSNTSSTFKNLCSVSSHEIVEATTDAAVGVATVVGSPLAWYDSTNGEIIDICNAQQATITGSNGITYTVQKEWSNKASACVAALGLLRYLFFFHICPP